MIEEQYDILLELQKIDIDIDKEEKKKRNLPLMIEGVTKEIQRLKNSLKNRNEDYKNLQIKLKRIELNLTEKSNKIKKHQEDLYGGKISDIKELKQIQKVIANYQKEKDSIEEDVLDLMEKAEDLDKSINHLDEDLKVKEEEFKKRKEEMDLESVVIKKNMDSLNIKRGEILNKITDDRLLKEYELLRKEKGGKAIMEVDGSICPGCYLDLPSDVIYQLKKNRKIVICPNCNRILIWKD
ncbi:MAG: C4-type zinc ribbon domain-containing protein [Candidatus Caldatribacteriota bacterium]|nr:C4-type zinc ribbon domain-containing protein [Candidatus Caldatribacteriota bacterium]